MSGRARERRGDGQELELLAEVLVNLAHQNSRSYCERSQPDSLHNATNANSLPDTVYGPYITPGLSRTRFKLALASATQTAVLSTQSTHPGIAANPLPAS